MNPEIILGELQMNITQIHLEFILEVSKMMNLKTGCLYGLGILVSLLVTSCSASKVDPVDNGGDSRNSDVVVANDGFDARDGRDAMDSSDLDADSSDVTLDADGVAGDGCGYADCTAMDTSTDAIVCGDVPQEGCPCDPTTDKPCCLEIAKGMSCENDIMIGDVLEYRWGVFWDCGCLDIPECGEQELYPMCHMQ